LLRLQATDPRAATATTNKVLALMTRGSLRE
jgi:hypothetical protein